MQCTKGQNCGPLMKRSRPPPQPRYLEVIRAVSAHVSALAVELDPEIERSLRALRPPLPAPPQPEAIQRVLGPLLTFCFDRPVIVETAFPEWPIRTAWLNEAGPPAPSSRMFFRKPLPRGNAFAKHEFQSRVGSSLCSTYQSKRNRGQAAAH